MQAKNQKNRKIGSGSPIFTKINWWLAFLLVYALLVRMFYPLTGSFAFIFDHGKDSLNVMEMWVSKAPKLIGPWTSIPGLYFGPAWYYFLAGCFLVGQWSPVSPVWGMIGLALVQVYLANKYFGKIAGMSVAAGTLWLIVTTSAWNPYPLTLVSWVLLILLQKITQDKQLTPSRVFWLGWWASLGCHFSSAYAVFYPVILVGCALIQRWKVNWRILALGFLGFVLPFLPQMVFELRHHFPQTQAVWQYVRGEREAGDSWSVSKMMTIGQTALSEWRLAALPDVKTSSSGWNELLMWVIVVTWLVIAVRWLMKVRRSQVKTQLVGECLLFIVVPTLAFGWLHFNVWYLLGMMPAVVVLVSQMIESERRAIQWVWLLALAIGGITTNIQEFIWQDVRRVDSFYAQVDFVWQEIKRLSEGENFSVYVYRPDIYDFNYQYLILRDARTNGQPLPVEFSYQSGETAYVPMKEKLMTGLEQQVGPPEYVFYIVEGRDDGSDYFQHWQGLHPDFERAEWVKTIGEGIEIYRVRYEYPVSVWRLDNDNEENRE